MGYKSGSACILINLKFALPSNTVLHVGEGPSICPGKPLSVAKSMGIKQILQAVAQ